jgi:plastocyanin
LKRFLRLALLPSFLVLLIAILWSCKSSGNKTMGTGSGGGGNPPDVLITITGNSGPSSFSPSPANVYIGETVAWKNNDGTTHRPAQDSGGFDTGNIGSGSTSGLVTITTLGDIGYHCAIHPTMVGTLHVTATP